MEQYIAHNARLELFVTDLLAKRGDAARSGVWRLLPEDHPLAGAPQWLTDDFGLPEWVLPNIVGVRVHVSSSDP
ncbi:MAG TPA: hypothetical protein QF901_12195 [Gammaproteobacteria bacterium]|nr:hypothetical protein [Gammaproteobacteria bacterium]